MTSVHDITLTRPPVPVTVTKDQDERAAMFHGIRKLMAEYGPNQNVMVDLMINALIYQEINTTSGIIGAGIRLDCNRGHVAIRLKYGLGSMWSQDSGGIYHNLI